MDMHHGHHMDHAAMDHGDMGHGGMDHGHSCNMNMLFTWDTQDLCIVFRSWHIYNTWSLIWSLAAIIVLCAGYEGVRELSRRYEAASKERVSTAPTGNDQLDVGESSSLLVSGRSRQNAERSSEVIAAAFYAVQVFYSFFIMLLFMTYNGWVMIAVAVGAFVGHMIFGKTSATKSVACH